MTHYRKLFLYSLGLLFSLRLFAADAGLILKNGRIWTADPDNPWAEAIAIGGSRILAAGNNETVAGLAGPHAQVIDLHGRLAIPGFNDAGLHFLAGSLALGDLDLDGACSVADLQKRLRDWAAAHPHEPWITGSAFNPSCLSDHRPLTRLDLDAALRDRPVFLRASDLHSAWVNSKALQLAGLLPPGHFSGAGLLVADPKSNDPTGCLRDAALAAAARLLPEPSRARKLAALEQGMKLASSLGVTSVQNSGGDAELLSLFDELDRQRKLAVRVSVALSVSPSVLPDSIDHFLELRQTFHGLHLRAGAVRFVLDGSAESRAAALLAPYTDLPASNGRLNWTPEVYQNMVALADAAGLPVVTDAAGDRAVRIALDAYEFAHKENGLHDARFRIEKIETLAPADVPRFARAGVLASVAPLPFDPAALDACARALGPERLKFALPWHSLEQSGARLVFSSGWPTSPNLDPLRAIFAAVNRQTPDGKPAGGWMPAQRLGLEEALRAYTANAAFATFEERQKGRLKAGLLADIVVLSQDLFNTPASDLYKAKVDLTIFDGRIVYTRE
jgi:predicted amidohydrolase YtcJ